MLGIFGSMLMGMMIQIWGIRMGITIEGIKSFPSWKERREGKERWKESKR